jgi:hypothetical protein
MGYTRTKGHLVYVLRCPDTRAIRYCGRSSCGLKRPRQHWRTRKDRESNDRVHRWIRKLLRRNRVPVVEVVEVVEPGPDANARLDAAERRWIFRLLSEGHDLTNSCLPDSETSTPVRRGWSHSRIVRRKISAAKVGRRLWWRAALRQAARPDRKPVIETQTGQWFSSISEAARRLRVPASHVSAIANGKGRLRSIHGHRFIFDTPESSQVAPEGLNATGRSGIGAGTVKAPEAS